MKQKLKNIIKKTSIYSILRTHKRRKAFSKFDKNDIKRSIFYSQFINPDDIVFDVGANLGNRTKVFIYLNAKVVAFEPQKRCADFLYDVLCRESRFTLVRKALGTREGESNMYISNVHTISSLSKEWINATQQSGRFNQYKWEVKQPVEITTLDKSIEKYGKPSFIKIDVEGYEFEVLSGLSVPIQCISIEVVPEYIKNAYKCIDHIISISKEARFQLSMGESMEFALDSWVSSKEIKNILANLKPPEFGDVYICSK